MSKDSGGFLRKVARFVANPTTDWTQLDAPTAGSPESEYAKTEIKAMIERKRRNDFVRKRELDMLRKIRREGLSQDNALALSGASNLDSESRPHSGPKSDIAVKAKIDAIEQQMVGDQSAARQAALQQQAQATPQRPPPLPLNAAAAYAPTAPNDLGKPEIAHARPELSPLEFDPPVISQAVFDSARANQPRLSGSPPPPLLSELPNGFSSGNSGVDVTEMEHDPELDEAVIAFANADFDECERALLALIAPGGVRHHQSETWMAVFDLYRALDLPQKFDHLAVSFAHQFGLSAPHWYSLPQRVTAFVAVSEQQAAEAARLAQDEEGPATEPGDEEATVQVRPLEGWLSPAVIDSEAVAQLRYEILQLPRPWTMDWSGVEKVAPEGAAQLSQLMKAWAKEPIAMSWIGVDQLLTVLAESSPSGTRDVDPAYWMLRLDTLRLCNQPDQFDEVAIDYCVTYELSPPSWEPSACQVRQMRDGVTPHSMMLSHVSDVTTSFVESQLHDDIEFVQVAALNLSGQLIGDISEILRKLDNQLGASITLDIDCEHLLRVDFIAAGDLLNWVLARRAEDREVTFVKPHRLVALFFGAMGINEHAKVKLQLI